MEVSTPPRSRPLLAAGAAPLLLRRQLSGPAILRISLAPVLAIGMLLALAVWFREPFEGPWLILVLIVFSLTFPGAIYRPRGLIALARDVLLNWLVVVMMLVFLGYASGYLALFPARMVLTWTLIVPGL